MYTLLNVIKSGLKKLNKTDDKHSKSLITKMEQSLRLDFMSGIFFRVFENLKSEANDPRRFKLDIMVNNGSLVNPSTVPEIEGHCIPISLEKSYSRTLTLNDIDTFFAEIFSLRNSPNKGAKSSFGSVHKFSSHDLCTDN
mmetsp:Transcript_3709/g.5593  ORF Transcript_3709/g.5593 Transcript_3709/m.5593 type:complete len:140 (-) Transcript_3709:105-524(-)